MYSQDIDTLIDVTEEEQKIALEGAYYDGGLIGELKRSLEDLHKPFSGMLETSEEIPW